LCHDRKKKRNISVGYQPLYIIAHVEQKAKDILRLSLRISDLPSLALEVCEDEGVYEAGPRLGLRKREVMKSRRIFCQRAVRK
jgi:hypothetical protein